MRRVVIVDLHDVSEREASSARIGRQSWSHSRTEGLRPSMVTSVASCR